MFFSVFICIVVLSLTFVVFVPMLKVHCTVECCADDNMSTCSVDEADFQPLQDQLVTLDAADSDAESIDSEQENALKYVYFHIH